MKTGIKITGQISSTSTLSGAISGNEIDIKPLQFRNEHILIFRTKGDAVKALSEGYQYLKEDETVSYYRGVILSCDAGTAIIIDIND